MAGGGFDFGFEPDADTAVVDVVAAGIADSADSWAGFCQGQEHAVGNRDRGFAEFVVDNLHDAEEIARYIRSRPFVKSTATLVSYSNKKYRYFAETMLEDMVREAGY